MSVFTFIGNLRANIIKTLITMDITDFSVDDKIDYKLENKKEIKRKGLPQKMCREIDCTFFIPFPKIKKLNLKINLKLFGKVIGNSKILCFGFI
jgi:hypothetical protein